METLATQGAAPAAPVAGYGYHAHTFDPRRWLDTFAALGGLYALDADKRLVLVTRGPCGSDLAGMVALIMGEPERQEAVRAAIWSRAIGEVQP